jgi:hypothetical protein
MLVQVLVEGLLAGPQAFIACHDVVDGAHCRSAPQVAGCPALYGLLCWPGLAPGQDPGTHPGLRALSRRCRSTSGLTFLLPAFAGAFLSATTIQPGRFNAWGSFAAVYFLVTGIDGLSLLGIQVYVQDLFYGAAPIVAVSVSILSGAAPTRPDRCGSTPPGRDREIKPKRYGHNAAPSYQ